MLGTLKAPRLRPNGRSSDFIAPSQSNGCAMSCAYCYVPRRKGFAMAAEVTLLTHNDRLHEELLWTPDTQEPK